MAFLLINTILFAGCIGGEESSPCHERSVPHDSVEVEHEWMQRHKVGDTIKLNVYRVNKDSVRRKYEYIGQETYIAANEYIEQRTEHDDNAYDYCNKDIFRYYQVLNFSGKRKLEVILKPQYKFDWLVILFNGKEYRIDNDQYDYRGRRWYANLNIGGVEYSNVNSFTGYTENYWPNTGSYKDSTYSFYNYNSGILKFIVNDTLVFQRTMN